MRPRPGCGRRRSGAARWRRRRGPAATRPRRRPRRVPGSRVRRGRRPCAPVRSQCPASGRCTGGAGLRRCRPDRRRISRCRVGRSCRRRRGGSPLPPTILTGSPTGLVHRRTAPARTILSPGRPLDDTPPDGGRTRCRGRVRPRRARRRRCPHHVVREAVPRGGRRRPTGRAAPLRCAAWTSALRGRAVRGRRRPGTCRSGRGPRILRLPRGQGPRARQRLLPEHRDRGRAASR